MSLITDTKQHIAFERLRKLMGYVENGSESTVTIFQDDATRDYCLHVKFPHGEVKNYCAASIYKVIETAYLDNLEHCST